ncbi:methyl-accepting chemotaxis protein [Desulfovibrio litoralis]|uniref:Methyl-accepting chemotaxis protein n=1 Tax=Desulfovibrio litoralis DSM 11393 TaxID=1121455 RepID=A0A1M7SDW4_9BACT|nr:methyl-accepting chemotaxis protein [Desulfovibrio litoralis]SHN56462.1 methyl-accepting chemotaxis protein [Desulfovibrio litoralis DSM 11393]
MATSFGINKKIGLIFFALLLVIMFMAGLFIVNSKNLSQSIERNNTAQEIIKNVLGREIDHLRWVNSVQEYVFNNDKKTLSVQQDPHKCAFGVWYYGEGRKEAEKLFPELIPLLKNIEAYHSAMHQSVPTIIKFHEAGDTVQSVKTFEDITLKNLSGLREIFTKIRNILQTESNKTLETLAKTTKNSLNITYIGVAFAIVLAGIFWLIMSKIITKPIIQLSTFVNNFSAGKDTLPLELNRGDEIGILSTGLNNMVDNITTMLKSAEEKNKEVQMHLEHAKTATEKANQALLEAEKAKKEGMQQAADSLENIVEQANNTAHILAEKVIQAHKGSELQCIKLAESSSAMHEMTSTVIEVSRNASLASNSASETRQNADKGSSIVDATIKAIYEVSQKAQVMSQEMNVLGEQAQGIGQIMTVITDIADQTNLLALNAAIEAARAGEAGRGFAVVADEVRKLAEKTMAATKQVGDVIREIQKSTTNNIQTMSEAGVVVMKSSDLAKEAGQALVDIVKIAEATSDKVLSIATASEEQSQASEEINQGMSAIHRFANENTELMVDATKLVEELSQLNESISSLVTEFKKS